MRCKPLFIICLYCTCVYSGSQLVRTLGIPGLFSATVEMRNVDTTRHFADSLCPRYWYVNWSEEYGTDGWFDYRITIRRQGKPAGTILIFTPKYGYTRYSPENDTLTCDSLGFGPPETAVAYGDFLDTVTADSAVFYWMYPRPVKRTVTATPKKAWTFENHLKVLLSYETVSDSIVFTREKVVFSPVRQLKKPFRQPSVTFALNAGNEPMFDIRGRRIRYPGTSSQLVIFSRVAGNAGTVPRRFFVSGK